MTKLDQKTIEDGCLVAYARYAAMTEDKARLAFAFELQGFTKCMVEDRGSSIHTVRAKIDDLIGLLAKANAKG